MGHNKGDNVHINNLIIAFLLCMLALSGCASSTGKSKASNEASLDRVNTDSVIRVAIFFTSAPFGEEGVLFDRERDNMPETVVRIHCQSLVPEWVRVRQCKTIVGEDAHEAYVYEIIDTPSDLEIYFQDGNAIVKRTFTVNDGELTLKPVEVAANISRY